MESSKVRSLLGRPWLPPVLLGCGATVAAMTVFYRAVLSDRIFISRDIHRVYYPLKQYWVERISHGQFPHWYPYDGLGQPFVGMVISGAFHPSNLLYLFFPSGTALKLHTLLCYPLAFVGVYLFARRWKLATGASVFAAALFVFNGYSICITNNLLYLTALATFPWALWAADRFFEQPTMLRAVVSAIVLALILFAGDSQSFVVCAALVVILAVARSTSGSLGKQLTYALGALGLSGLFSAVQILPALSVYSHGLPSQQTVDASLLWSMHPLRILELVLGPLFGGDSTTPGATAIDLHLLKTGMTTLWVESVHFGLPGLFFAVAAFLIYRRRALCWLITGSSAAFLLLVLGRHAGVYELLHRYLPGWKAFRYPEKLLPYLLFLFSLAAAAGLQAVLEHKAYRRLLWLFMGGAAVLTFALYLLEARFRLFSHYWLHALPVGISAEQASVSLHRNFLASTAQTTLTVLALGLVVALVKRNTLSQPLITLLCFAHLAIANEHLYDLAFPDVLKTPTLFVRAIRDREREPGLGHYRVFAALDKHTLPRMPSLSLPDRYALSVATSLQPSTPALWGLESSSGYLPAQSPRVHELAAERPIWLSKFSGLFNTRYITIPTDVFEQLHGDTSNVIAQHPFMAMLLLHNPTAAPRAIIRRLRCARAPEESFRILSSQDFNPQFEAVAECPPEISSSPADAVEGNVQMISYAPERVEMVTQTSRPALLVLNDAFYSGWTAMVDGAPTPILRANYAVRGVQVSAGTHSVVFYYRTPAFSVGARVSLLALAFGLFWAASSCRNSALRYQKTSVPLPR